MRAAVYKEKGVLKVEEVPDPAVGPRDVLLKVSHCAICGSDLHRYIHGMLRPGAIMGHEYSGTVADKGAEVSEFRIGERVVRSGGKRSPWTDPPPYPPRFSAKERGFLASTRPGAYAEYFVTDADLLMRIPDAVTNLEASLVEPLCVTHNCPVWVYRVDGDRYEPLLGDVAGYIEGITVLTATTNGAFDIRVQQHSSAVARDAVLYRFDGKRYQARECSTDTYDE
ncbi:MAG: hypothetical protein H6Q87_687, partial [candidate division NC10 bacterium]|nr:hypothetical protein [candidate division NC10 bacterium]